MTISRETIDTCLWSIQREMMKRHGCNAAERAMCPLNWYIQTGRASTDFLKCLIEARPVLLGRDLMKGGTDSEIINRICKRIKYDRAEY